MRFALAAFPVLALATLAGCGSSASSAPMAAWSVEMIQSDPQECTIADNTEQIGAVTATDIGMTVVDGTVDAMMNTISVTCTVSGTSTYVVQAQASEGAQVLNITIPSIDASASMSNPAMGSISYESAATADDAFQGSCGFFFESGMGTAPPIAAGRIWVAFTCAALQSGMVICPVNQGFAVFEDCLTEAEM
jgi:hypothetical protein